VRTRLLIITSAESELQIFCRPHNVFTRVSHNAKGVRASVFDVCLKPAGETLSHRVNAFFYVTQDQVEFLSANKVRYFASIRQAAASECTVSITG
jgi:hypothetical protein